ncbi:MAG: sulfotransferase, partial [Cyanobacteria bacterium J06560_2]
MTPIRRCGSHALRLRLNLSDEFYSPYPLHIVEFMPLVPLYGNLENDFNYFQLIIDVVGLQSATMVKWEAVSLDPVVIFERLKDRPRSIHAITWEMLFLAGKKHGAKVVMDKSLDSVHYAKDLIALFDDMLFLNVVRDPRAQISSINRAIIHDFDSLLNTLRWVSAQEAGRALAAAYPEKVLTIRYEDFIQNQAAVLQRVCEFLGIPFSAAMLNVLGSQEAQGLAVLSALW